MSCEGELLTFDTYLANARLNNRSGFRRPSRIGRTSIHGSIPGKFKRFQAAVKSIFETAVGNEMRF